MNNLFSISYSSGEKSGKVTWRSPSNIALVKYWGKRERQLPANPSLSVSLNACYTETTVEYEFIESLKNPAVQFDFAGEVNTKFQARISAFIQNRILDIPDVSHLKMHIHTTNSFPHSAGIASSASAFSALALCLCSIEEELNGTVSGNYDFFRKASYLARLGSGSACRSVYGGYVVWGENEDIPGFSNLYGTPLPGNIHPVFTGLQDTILVVSSEPKKLSSSEGHALMNSHPYAPARYLQSVYHMNELVAAIRSGDLESFVRIVENEALSLHALIMSSEGGAILMKPATLAVIQKVRDFREQSMVPLCFTLDAGPNIHLLYSADYKEEVRSFVESELSGYCEGNHIIYDALGAGPQRIQN